MDKASALIDPSSSIPKYLQLQQILADAIDRGEWRVGERVCTEQELRERYQVSAGTVTRALRELARRGLVSRKRGGGTFLRARHPSVAADREALTVFVTERDCMVADARLRSLGTINWFISYDLNRGIVNSCEGCVRLLREVELPAALAECPPDQRGAILVDPARETLEFLERESIPFVRFLTDARGPKVAPNTIVQERVRAVYDGMAHLIDTLGHRDIAFVTSGSRAHHDRFVGYALALQAFNIPYRGELAVRDKLAGTFESGVEAMQRLLAGDVPFTAAFVDTAMKALGAIHALREAGRRVPEDVSILAFDDYPGLDKADPPLTTIAPPYYDVGATAVRMLRERIASDWDVPGCEVSARLVIRESCARRTEAKEAVPDTQAQGGSKP